MKKGFFLGSLFLILILPVLWVWPPRGLEGRYYDHLGWNGDPAFTLLDQQITLDAVGQHAQTFPQENFSVNWIGWIRIDRAGEYRFATESDDGSSIVIADDALVVDNGGFHTAQKKTGKIFLTEGLHHILISFFQSAGSYELEVFWTKPGGVEMRLPRQVLYPRPFPLRGIGWLTRHLNLVYPACWVLFLLAITVPALHRAQMGRRQLLKRYAQNVALSIMTVVVMGLLIEAAMRIALSFQENRKDFRLLLQESQATSFNANGRERQYSLKGIVQASPYPGIVYELKPNLRGIFMDAPLTTNSRGLRDNEYRYQKSEQTFRIVGLGDSSMFGWGVKLEETMLKVLEQKLNQPSSARKYQVINFAAPGYNTAIEADVFVQKCLKYDPDLVIMHFNTNDYDVPGFMKPPQRSITLRKSYFLNFVYARLQSLWEEEQRDMIPVVATDPEKTERLDEDPNFPEEYRYMVGQKGFLRAMDKLVNATNARHIPLVVYVVKAYPGLDPAYKPKEFRDNQLQLITQLSQEKGFFLLNMYPAYVKYRQEHPEADNKVFWVTAEDTHPSALANRVEAEACYDFLIANKLIPLR